MAAYAFLFALFAHLIGNPHYGFFRDELYFVMCGFRPAWGYVDQPPLIPLLAAASQRFGTSLILLRAIPALFSAGSVLVTCLLTTELGGQAFAQALAAIAAFFCPVLMSFGATVSTDTVGLLLWPLIALWLLRATADKPKYWCLVGAGLGIAFQGKYSVVFFALALFLGLLLTSRRRSLRSWWCLAGLAIGAAIALPNVLWQAHAGFPMLELLKNGRMEKNVLLGPGQFLASQLLITNPFLSLIWICGLAWLWRRSSTRFLAIAFLALMVEMIALHGKHYYPADVYPILFAAGGVAIEKWTDRVRFSRPWLIFATIAFGIVMVPLVMPVLPINSFIAYDRGIASVLPLGLLPSEKLHLGRLPQKFADMQGWPELATKVVQVVESLSAEEREKVVIAAGNYGEAAALEFFGRSKGMPPVISGHNQYFLWGTAGRAGEVLIDVGGNCGKSIGLYRSSKVAAVFESPYVMPYEDHLPIRICHGPTRAISEIWPRVKHYW